MENIALMNTITNNAPFRVINTIANCAKDKTYIVSFKIDGRASVDIDLVKGTICKKLLSGVYVNNGEYKFKLKSSLSDSEMVLKLYRPKDEDTDDRVWRETVNISVVEA